MAIPGHAPQPDPPSRPRPGEERWHRDNGLNRVARLTTISVTGGLALVGGLAVVAANSTTPHAGASSVSTTTQTVPPTASAPTLPVTAAPTVPAATTPPSAMVPSPTASSATAPRVTVSPPTSPPRTIPPRPAATMPVYTPQAPVVASGSS